METVSLAVINLLWKHHNGAEQEQQCEMMEQQRAQQELVQSINNHT